ncbi:lytic murein transglycosylase [Streptomyces sp. AV19]|uniref:lytic transglycosylase domain-containing protein n=1 Tax=Streptomyces sp. AV19 TaxID=2793068 RepID=UPI0018FEFA71|nr:lytic murein transglycosylase [Streptomyces sp. AV19]MBH1935410.1 lytic murein transglycosylase [Streptomyces sp. AV19]MDG4531296.1 lytic murein transglycosylase [Streptomyces sp. AV19]
MKILRTRAASVSRQGLCTALLVASLTAAVAGASPPHPKANAEDPAPGPGNPQSLPHGSPNLALPDLVPPPGSGKPGPGGPGSKEEVKGIPATALAAYKNAERYAKEQWPDCNVSWELIAAIGKVESEHGAMGGGLRPDGSTEKAIIGPRLTGEKFALVRDTDGGRWDGDTQYDHAIGPMQFIPSTWASYSADGRGTGQKDPNNIFDAAAGTARYLCAGGLDLSKQADLEKAVLRYNASREYLNSVVAWMNAYRNGEGGAIPEPSGSTPYPGSTPRPTRPVPTAPGTPGTTPPAKTPPSTRPERPGDAQKPGGDRDKSPAPGKSPDRQKPGDKDKPGDKGKPTPTPPARAARLDRVDDEELTATVGGTFKQSPSVRAFTADGKAAPRGTRIRFEIIGKTEARFPDGTRTASVVTGQGGLATAKKISAGDKPGDFTIRAAVEGLDLKPVYFDATVEAPRAARFAAVGGDLKLTKGTSAKEKTVAKAYDADGKPVAGVKVTVTVLKNGQQAGTGPYFGVKDGKQIRTTTVTTDADGLVTLKELFAGDQDGTFNLMLSTDGDKPTVLPLKLTVDKDKDKPTTPGSPGTKPTPTGQATAKSKPTPTSSR